MPPLPWPLPTETSPTSAAPFLACGPLPDLLVSVLMDDARKAAAGALPASCLLVVLAGAVLFLPRGALENCVQISGGGTLAWWESLRPARLLATFPGRPGKGPGVLLLLLPVGPHCGPRALAQGWATCPIHKVDASKASLEMAVVGSEGGRGASAQEGRRQEASRDAASGVLRVFRGSFRWTRWRPSNTARAPRTACMPSTTPAPVPRWWGTTSGATCSWTPLPCTCSCWRR